MIALEDEFSQAVCSINSERLAALRAAGVPDEAFGKHLVGMAPIQTHPGGLFDLAEVGDLAVVLPAGEWDGLNWIVDDIVAFYLDRPDKWYRRRGAAVLLGEVHHFAIEPRHLHRRPLDWLVNEGRGLCILDWSGNPAHRLVAAGPLVIDRFLENRLRKSAVKAAAAYVKGLVRYG